LKLFLPQRSIHYTYAHIGAGSFTNRYSCVKTNVVTYSWSAWCTFSIE
jgi:hypothetical protein